MLIQKYNIDISSGFRVKIPSFKSAGRERIVRLKMFNV